MKNYFIKLFLFFFLFSSVDFCFAQIGIGIGSGGFGIGMNIPVNRKNPRNEQRIEKQIQQLKTDLNLNEEQEKNVRNLIIERDRRSQQSRKKVMSHEEFDQRMQGILTPEQNARFNEIKQQKRESRMEKEPEKKQDNKKEALPESQRDDVYR